MSETCIKLGELGARVMIENKEIPHYGIDVDPAKKEVSCWIPSEAGKAFSVVWLDFDVDYPSAGVLYLDGHVVTSLSRNTNNAKPAVFQHGRVSESLHAPFLFSSLVVTDDDTYLDASPSPSLGEIKLDIFRTTVPEKVAKLQPPVNARLPHLQKVHERSKKAIAHRVNYGAEIPVSCAGVSSKRVERLVTFTFKYRPLDMLRANDIAPQIIEPQVHAPDTVTSSTSETSSGKGKQFKVKKEVVSRLETDDEDSIREKALLAELQRCQAEAERCQAEVERIRKGRRQLNDSELERPKKKVKKEEKPFFTPGEIIDLT